MENYEIGQADRQGHICFSDLPHYVDLKANSKPTLHVFQYILPLEQASHLVVHPFGGRETFFFDGIQLPRNPDTELSSPPAIRFEIHGMAGNYVPAAWDPVRVSLQALAGRLIRDSIHSVHSTVPGWTGISVRDKSLEDPDGHSTWIVEAIGLTTGRLKLAFFAREGNALPEGRFDFRSPARIPNSHGPPDS